MAVNSYRLMIIRNRKNEDFSVKFFFTFYNFIKFYNSFYSNSYIIRVLLIYNIKCRGTALYFVR